jgi:hypothetical protein
MEIFVARPTQIQLLNHLTNFANNMHQQITQKLRKEQQSPPKGFVAIPQLAEIPHSSTTSYPECQIQQQQQQQRKRKRHSHTVTKLCHNTNMQPKEILTKSIGLQRSMCQDHTKLGATKQSLIELQHESEWIETSRPSVAKPMMHLI